MCRIRHTHSRPSVKSSGSFIIYEKQVSTVLPRRRFLSLSRASLRYFFFLFVFVNPISTGVLYLNRAIEPSVVYLLYTVYLSLSLFFSSLCLSLSLSRRRCCRAKMNFSRSLVLWPVKSVSPSSLSLSFFPCSSSSSGSSTKPH